MISKLKKAFPNFFASLTVAISACSDDWSKHSACTRYTPSQLVWAKFTGMNLCGGNKQMDRP
eukprot:1015705-Rhodomonas_salina.2